MPLPLPAWRGSCTFGGLVLEPTAAMIEIISYQPHTRWEISGLRGNLSAEIIVQLLINAKDVSGLILPSSLLLRLKGASSFNESVRASSGMGAARTESCVRKETASRRDLMINIWRGEYGLKVEGWRLKTSLTILLLSMSFYTCDWSNLDPLFRPILTTFVLSPAPSLSIALERLPLSNHVILS